MVSIAACPSILLPYTIWPRAMTPSQTTPPTFPRYCLLLSPWCLTYLSSHRHQPLMAKKMQRLEASADFRPFKFRIQAFTNAFHESLIQNDVTEDILPLRKVKVYLWNHKCISRFNEDGKKQKSKGNHTWNIEARKLASSSSCEDVNTIAGTEGQPSSPASTRWEFREFQSRIAGPIIKFARVGILYVYTPKIWDPQTPCKRPLYVTGCTSGDNRANPAALTVLVHCWFLPLLTIV